MKHTQVSHELDDMKSQHLLEHGDKIIYCAIKQYMNKDTRVCFPSIPTISQLLKCSPNKVKSAIKRLVANNVIQVTKDGRKNSYYFPESDCDKRLEMFTHEFIKLDLELNVKEYYMDIQQYLYGKETGIGKCSFSNAELARRTGWSIVSVKKYNTILIEKGLLEENSTDFKDESGLPIVQKSFDLNGLQQASLWVKAVTEQITTNTQDIEQLKEDNAQMRKELDDLKKQLSLQRNKTEDIFEFKF